MKNEVNCKHLTNIMYSISETCLNHILLQMIIYLYTNLNMLNKLNPCILYGSFNALVQCVQLHVHALRQIRFLRWPNSPGHWLLEFKEKRSTVKPV